MTSRRASWPLVLGLSIGFAAAVVPGCRVTEACGPDTCNGCCDANGCQPATNEACGRRGEACRPCLDTETCRIGRCTALTSPEDAGLEDAGVPSPVVVPATYREFTEEIARKACERELRCGRLTIEGLRDCLSRKRLFATHFGGSELKVVVERSLQLGAAVWDAGSAYACLLSVSTLPCGYVGLDAELPACTHVTTPTAAAGGRCVTNADCPGALTCNGATCARRCTAGGGVEEYCRADGSCDAPQSCYPLGPAPSGVCTTEPIPGTPCPNPFRCGASLTCQSGQCKPLPAVGSACPDGVCLPDATCSNQLCVAKRDAGTSCGSLAQCLDGACLSGVCGRPGGPGASCVDSRDCRSDTVCRSGQCAPRLGPGASCLGVGSDCALGLGCDDVSGTCERFTQAGPGEACSSTRRCEWSAQQCRQRARDGGVMAGTCELPQVGDLCGSHRECGLAQYCATTCRPALVGTPCATSANCRPTELCDGTNSTCTAKAQPGQTCVDVPDSCFLRGESCQSQPATCRRTPTVAQACTTDCAFPSTCINGRCVAQGRVGQPCFAGAIPCIEGECLMGNGSLRAIGQLGGMCSSPRADGQTCLADVGCISGFCDGPDLLQRPGVCAAGCQ